MSHLLEDPYEVDPHAGTAADRVEGVSGLELGVAGASAVGSGLVDFALGTDTGGSVRIPAAFCGICGFRPSHGAVSLDGVIPLAPSFDTVGWFARDAGLLATVGDVLLRPSAPRELGDWVVPEEILERSDARISERFMELITRWVPKQAAPRRIRLETLTGFSAESWTNVMRILQGHEIARVHGPWIETVRPRLAPEIAARFAWAQGISDDEAAEAGPQREVFAQHLDEVLGGGSVLCLPTAPVEAPALDASREIFRDFRQRTFVSTAIAGLARLPQISLPALPGSESGGVVAGISFTAARGTDRALLELARKIDLQDCR